MSELWKLKVEGLFSPPNRDHLPVRLVVVPEVVLLGLSGDDVVDEPG